MKKKIKRYGKRTVSVLLSLMMIMSCMIMGQIAAIPSDAAEIDVQSSGDTALAVSDTTMLVAAFTDTNDMYYSNKYLHSWYTLNNKDTDITSYPSMTYANYGGVHYYIFDENNLPSSPTHIKYALCTAASWTNAWDRTDDNNFTKDTQWVAWRTSSSGSGNFETFKPIQITSITESENSITAGDTVTLTVKVDGGFPWFYKKKLNNNSDGKKYKITVTDDLGNTIVNNESITYGGDSKTITFEWNPTVSGTRTLTYTVEDNDNIDSVSYSKQYTVNASTITGVSVNAKLGTSNAATNSNVTFTGTYSGNTTISSSIDSGTALGITAPDTITDGGTKYYFSSWSAVGGTVTNEAHSGSDNTATFTPTANDATATAVYRQPVTITLSRTDGEELTTAPTLESNIQENGSYVYVPGSTAQLIHTKNSNDVGILTAEFNSTSYSVKGQSPVEIDIPDTLTDGGSYTLSYTTGTAIVYSIKAAVDSRYTDYGTISVTVNGVDKTAEAASEDGYLADEDDEVSVTLTDTNPTGDEYIIDQIELSGTVTSASGSLVSSKNATSGQTTNSSTGRVNKNGTRTNSSSYNDIDESITYTFTPTSNIILNGLFKEDPGVTYSSSTNSYYMMYSNNDDFTHSGTFSRESNFAGVMPIVRTVTGSYYTYFTEDVFYYFKSNTNCYMSVTTSSSVNSGNVSNLSKIMSQTTDNNKIKAALVPAATSTSGSTISNSIMAAEPKNRNSYNMLRFSISSKFVNNLKIKIAEDPSYWSPTYTLIPTVSMTSRDDESNYVYLLAKDGTYRESYKKYADLAETSVSGNSSDIAAKDNTAYNYTTEIAYVKQGSTVTITTEIGKNRDKNHTTAENLSTKTSLISTYYVKAFDVNGVTYFPTTSDTSTGVYTLDYTVPTDIAANSRIEITPIYYYQNESNTITFYVEGFDGEVKTKWGGGDADKAVLSCYAWYKTSQGYDTVSATDANKPALGGYPGQPMVYINGRYEMQVPKYVNGNSITGITLNNYVWDFVHSDTLGASSDSARESKNCQTYDYDDFVELAKLTDEIIFQFKYSRKHNPGSDSSEYSNRANGNTPGNTYSNSYVGNGWEVYTDYYGNVINLRNERDDADINATNILSVSDVTSQDKYYRIVSDGYKCMYYGHFAVRWSVYLIDTTNHTQNRVARLPSSAFFYDPYARRGELKSDVPYTGTIGESDFALTKSSVPDSFISALDNTTRRGKSGIDSRSFSDYWSDYVDLYNSCSGIPAVITYETAIKAEDSNNNGHPRDPGLRNDGRWYYSKANASWEWDRKDPTAFTANIVVEYLPKAGGSYTVTDSNYLEDSYVASVNRINRIPDSANIIAEDNLETTSDYIGNITGAKPSFTTDNPGYAFATVVVDNSSNLGFQVTAPYETKGYSVTTTDGSTYTYGDSQNQTYQFVGWYVKTTSGDQTVYSPVNKTELAKLTGEVAKIGTVTLVARYKPIDTEILTISHELYSKAAKYENSVKSHNGTGTTAISVQLTDANGSNATNVTLAGSGETYVALNSVDLASQTNKYLTITLTTTPTDSGKIFDVYRKYNSEDGNGTGDDTTGYVSFSSSTQTTGPNSIADWTSVNQTSNSIKDATTATTITYRVPVSSLIDSNNNDALRSKFIKFYSDISGTRVNVQFKYYDRNDDTAHGLPETVDTEATVVTVEKVSMVSGNTTSIANAVTTALTSSADGTMIPVSSIASVMNQYYFWATQEDASSGFKNLQNLHNIEDRTKTYDKTITNKDNLNYHANPYGYVNGEAFSYNGGVSQKYTTTEKWVTYYAADGTPIPEEAAVADPGIVEKVVVWGFNKPREYKITFSAPKPNVNDDDLSIASTGTLATGITAFTSSASSNVTLTPYTGNYNERVGKFYSGNQGVNDLSPYLKAVYGVTGSSTTGKLGITDDTSDRTAKEFITKTVNETETKFVFDGWYAFINNSFTKISSDRTYADRITSSLNLTAGYRVYDENAATPTGLTITKNATERFIDDNGVARVRYAIEVTPYGYVDSDPKIKDIGIVYIILNTNETYGYDKIEKIVEAIKADSNFISAMVASNSSKKRTAYVYVDLDKTDDYKNATALTYAYDVETTGGNDAAVSSVSDGVAKLTNKNNVSFTLTVKDELVADGKAYSDIVVMAAITYDNDGTDGVTAESVAENNGDEIVYSNLLRYHNGQ